MRCPKCKKLVPLWAHYCPFCGTLVSKHTKALPPASPIPGADMTPSIVGPYCEWHQRQNADTPDFSTLPERARPAFDPYPDAPEMSHRPLNPWCAAGFIMGLASVFLNLGIIGGAVACLVSVHGMKKARLNGEGGSKFAAIGLAAGVLALAVGMDFTHITRFGDFHFTHHWIRIGACWLSGLPWLH